MNEEILLENTQDSLNSSGQGLIDATQNAIIGAAENVSEIIAAGKTAATKINEVPFYTEIEFWIAVAFVLSVLVLLKPLTKAVRAGLENRINNVVKEIDDAAKLRDDAQLLLAEYERKFVNAQAEAEHIVEQSRKNLQNIKKHELSRLKTELKNKETEAERRIAASTTKAKDEINLSASKVSIDLAKKTINQYLQNADRSKLIDEAIADLDKFVQKS